MFHLFAKYGLLISLTVIIISDFLHHLPFMAWYIQYGPFILFWMIVSVVALLEKTSGQGKDEKEEIAAAAGSIKRSAGILIYLLALFIALKSIFGQPASAIFDYQASEFWYMYFFLLITMIIKSWSYIRLEKFW